MLSFIEGKKEYKLKRENLSKISFIGADEIRQIYLYDDGGYAVERVLRLEFLGNSTELVSTDWLDGKRELDESDLSGRIGNRIIQENFLNKLYEYLKKLDKQAWEKV